MKKFGIILGILTLLIPAVTVAAPPSWSVNPATYSFNMNMTGQLLINDVVSSNTSNKVAAFVGATVRGVASPALVNGSWLVNMTVYANTNGETITFKTYDAATDQIADIVETRTFASGAIVGDPLNPFQWHAYINFDYPPVLAGIPDQTKEQHQSFATFDLDNYLTHADSDPIVWSISGNTNLSVSIDANKVVTINVANTWIGSETLIFTATEQTTNAKTDADTAIFTKLKTDLVPTVSGIPDQAIGQGGSFNTFDLDTFLTNPDNDAVTWSYAFQTTATGGSAPAWSVNPAGYNFSMTLTTLVRSRGVRASGGNHILAAFVGGQTRGTAQAISTAFGWLYFMTIYANANSEAVTFKFYDQTTGETLPVLQTLTFAANTSAGSPQAPREMDAGRLLISIGAGNVTTITIIDPDWTGSETVTFTAQDQGTLNHFSSSDAATFSIGADFSPLVAGIPDQTIESGQSFATFDLDNYLTLLDGNTVTWSRSGQSNLNVTIDLNNGVSITPVSGVWTGSETIVFRATDDTPNAYSDADTAVFTIRPFDDPPVLADIPNQTIGQGGSFTGFDLDTYLTEQDGDPILWSYAFQTVSQGLPTPSWSVNPANYSFSMSLTARVTARGVIASGANHRLGAFVGGQARGVGQAVLSGSDWLFFLTIYANTNNETVTFKFYDAAAVVQDTLPIAQSITFSANTSLGNALNPRELTAGNLQVSIGAGNVLSIAAINPTWSGSETVRFTAQDQGSLHLYSAFNDAVYSVNADHAPLVAGIPDQTITRGQSFAVFNLAPYLTESDGHSVTWSVTGNTNLNVNIGAAAPYTVTITSPDGLWTGGNTLIFRVQDVTGNAFADVDTATFTVNQTDNPPVVAELLDQTVEQGQTFTGFDLNNFLTEIDGQTVNWSHAFQTPGTTVGDPGWTANTSGFNFSMNMIVRVTSRGLAVTNSASKLAAFVGGQVRGVTTSTLVNSERLFFLNVASNTVGETVSFRFYDADAQLNVPVQETVSFVNGLVGSVNSPYALRAGFIIVTIDAQNAVTFLVPDATWIGNETIRFIAKDTGTVNLFSAFDQAVYTVSANNAVNDRPTALNDAYTTNEDTALNVAVNGVLANDSDPENNTLTPGVIGSVTGGSLILNPNGSFTFTPTLNFNGAAGFTYRLVDTGGLADTATVAITVIAVNDAPVAVADAFSVNEDNLLSVSASGVIANDLDVENSALTAELLSPVSQGALTFNSNGSFSYQPAANYNGPVSFTYRVSDGSLNSAAATVTITVNAVNDPPLASDDAYTVDEDNTLTIAAIAGVLADDTDIENNPLTAVLVAAPASGSLTLNPNGSFVYTPALNFNGAVTFTYQANDGAANSNTVTVTITVSPVNDPPVGVTESYAVDEDQTLSVIAANGVLINDTDVENNPLTAALVSTTSVGVLTFNTNGTFTYTPPANYSGADNFTYRANDGTANSNNVTVTITVNAVNDAPSANDDSYAVNEDNTLNVAASGILSNDFDLELNSMTAVLVSDVLNGVLTLNANGSFSYTPSANFNGTDAFVYRAFDGFSNSNTATVTITINSVNDAPIAGNDTYVTNEDTPLTRTAENGVLANDNDLESSTTATKLTDPANGSLTLNGDGSFIYTPAANFSGGDGFAYYISDSGGLRDTATVTLTINSLNDAPTLATIANPAAINEDAAQQTINLSGIGTGAANETQTLTITATSDNPALIPNPTITYSSPAATGTLRYTPVANANGTAQIRVIVRDNGGTTNGGIDSVAVTFTVTVNAINDAPTLTTIASPAAVNEDAGQQTVNLSGIGTGAANEAQTLTITAKSDNPGLIANPTVTYTSPNATGTLQYTPVANMSGTAQIRVVVRDNGGTTNSGIDSVVVTFTVTVNSVNDAPTLAAITNPAAIDEDAGQQTVNLSGIGTGAANETQTLTITATSDNPTLIPNPAVTYTSPNATGVLQYTPITNANGTAQIRVVIRDNGGTANSGIDSVIVTFTVTVTAVNDPPTLAAIANPAAINEDAGQQTINLSGIGTGAANEAQTLAITATSDNPALIANPTVVYTSPNATGTLQYTPLTNANGTAQVRVVVRDNGGGLDSIAVIFTVTVTAVNDAPVAAAQAVTTNEDAALLITLNAIDVDNVNLTYTIPTPPVNGSLTGTAPNLTYTPGANYNGADSLVFQVSDGALTSTATVRIVVTAVNDPPVATAQAVTTNEDTPRAITLTGSDVDGDALTFTVITNPTKGALSGTAPNLTYTPSANLNGSDSFTFRVGDGSANSAATISITITAVNDPPTATTQTITTNEDTPAALTLSGADIDNDPLTYTVVIQPTKGTVSGVAPNLTYTPNANVNGADSLFFVANDGTVNSGNTVVYLTITPINDPPVAAAQAVTTNEDTPINIVLAGTDVDGDALTYTVVAQPTKGVLSGSAPNLTYTPNPNTNGADNFTFRVSDGAATSSTVTVGITVNAVNDPPTANSDALTTAEDVALPITLTGSDIDNATLTYAVVTSPLNGTLSGTSPNLTYTPNTNFNGADSLTFKANDGTTDSPTAKIRITVTPINDAPLAIAQALSTNEDTPLTITLSGTDADGNPLTYEVLTQPVRGVLTGAAPNLTYTPNANLNGADSLTFRVSDGLINSAAVVVRITVNAINDVPVATAQTVSTNEDTPVAITLGGTDVDGNPLTFTVVTPPVNGVLSGTAPNLTYTPNTNFNGADSLVFKANDGTIDSPTAKIRISVTPANDAPTATAQALATNEDTALAITLSGADIDGNPLTFTVVTLPANGSLSGTAPNLTYTPNTNFNGADSLTFKANDGNLDSPTAKIRLTVNVVNDVPAATAQALTTNEDTPLVMTLTGTDIDGNSLTFTVVTPPINGALSGTAPNLTYTPNANFNGADSLVFKANDGTADSPTAKIRLSVSAVNDAPVATAQLVTTNEDTQLAITLAGTDVDGNALVFTVVNPPAKGVLTGTAPNLTYTPNTNVNGADSLVFKANDGLVDSPTAKIRITINAVNDAPTANPQSVTTAHNTAIPIILTGSDVDGNPLTFVIVTQPANGALSGTPPNVTFTPTNGFAGTTQFSFTVSDGQATSGPATVTISVNSSTNIAPVATSQAVFTNEDTALNIILTGTDSNNDPLTFTVLTSPAHGALTGTVPNLTYTPVAHFNGADSLTFRVNDGTVNSATATIRITVNAVNDPPTAAGSGIVTGEDSPATFTLTGSDPDGNALTFTVVTPPANGTLSGAAPNLTYTPNANFNGADSLTFKANDGTLDSAPAVIRFTVNAVNDPPTAASQTVATAENTPKAFTLIGADVDGNPLTYTVISQPTKGVLSGTAPNLTYTPNTNYNGPDSLTFKVNDGTVDSAPAMVRLNVTSVNSAPAATAEAVTTNEDTPLAVTLRGTDPDGDALTFAIVAPPIHGVLTGTAPNLTYTPNAHYNGPDSLTFKANDGTADSAPAVIRINVNAVNDGPTATAQSLTTSENTPLTITLGGTDADGNSLTYAVVNQPTKGVLSGTAPNLTYTPNANYNGPDSLTFKVNDGTTDSAPATVRIQVSSVNSAPVATAQAVTTNEDVAVAITLLGSDLDGDALTFAVVTPPAHGALTGAAPNVTYTPAANYNGADSLTFRVNDGTISSASATIRITISPVNDAPTATAQTVTTAENTPATITLTGSDVDGDALTYVIVNQPTHGTLSGTPPAMTYTPAANYNGTDNFSYRVNDPANLTAQAVVSITITAVNTPPTAAADAVTTNEDAALPLTLSATDTDGDALTFAIVTPPAKGVLSGTAPNLTYTPNANANGADSLIFRANDGVFNSAPATIRITINPINDIPTAQAQNVITSEDTPITVTLLGNDVDGNPLTFTIISQPTHGALSGIAPNLTYTPEEGYNGADNFTFRVNDGTVNSAPATIGITITGVNNPPTAAGSAVVTAEDIPVGFTLSGSDRDGDALTFTVTTPPQQGTLSGTAPNLVYTPNPNYNGADSLTFRASDGLLNSAPAVIRFTISPANDAPTATGQTLATSEDTPLSVTLAGSDIDGNPLTYTIVTQPARGTVTGTPPNIIYTPNPHYNGSDSFTFRVNDGAVNSSAATINITVNAVNDAPVVTNKFVTTNEDTPVTIILEGSDIDGDVLTLTVVTPPLHGTLSGAAPNLVYTPNLNFNGADSLIYRAQDAVTSSPAAVVRILVAAVNDAPAATAQALTTNEDTPLAITLAGLDTDGDALTYSVVTPSTRGILTGTAPNLTYTPNANFNGADSLIFRVNDGVANSAPVAIRIIVNSVNDPPVATSELVTTNEDTPVSFVLDGGDSDGNPLTFAIITPPLHGTLSGTAPALIYTPGTNFNGADSLIFRVNDGTVNSAPATVKITVNAANDAPTATAQAVTTNEDTPLTLLLTGTDADGNPLSFTLVSQPTRGTLTGTAPNLMYTPNTNFNGADSLTFRVNDGTVNSPTATVRITVNAVNDPPAANSDAITTTEDAPVSITLIGSDPDGNPLTYAITDAPKNGILNGAAPNLTYTPNANFNGVDSLLFQTNDGTINSPTAVVRIRVTAVNDAPAATSQTLATDEDTPLIIALAGSDADGNPLTFSVISQPARGTLTGAAPNLTYTPNANFNGVDSLTFKANDGQTDSPAATVRITIRPVNDAPVALAQSVSAGHNTAVNITLTGSDPEGSALIFAIAIAPANGALSGTAPNVTYTPNSGFAGTDQFTFTVNDGQISGAPATVTISVNSAGNRAPVALAQSLTTPEDTQLPLTLGGSDPDGNPLTFTVLSQPAHGQLTGTTPNLVYSPALNYFGPDSLTFRVNDGIVNSTTASVIFAVTPVNDAPTAANQLASASEDTPIGIVLSGNDVDGDALTFTISAAPLNGGLSGTAPNLIYTPNLNFHGADSLAYLATDGSLNSNPAKIRIVIIPVNDAPTATAQAVTTSEDTPLPITLSGSDPDGDALTFTLITMPQHGALTGAAPNLVYAPTAGYNGPDRFTFRVSDGVAGSSPTEVVIQVQGVNNPPLAVGDAIATDEDTPVAITLTASDADGDALSYTIVTPPAHGTLNGTAPNLIYMPAQHYFGQDSLVFRAGDGSLNSARATVQITILAVDDEPVAQSQNVNAVEDAPVTITLSGSDVDGGDLDFRILSQPQHGQLSGTAPSLIYTPFANDNGADNFTFQVGHDIHFSTPAVVSILISPVNDAPVAAADLITTGEDSPVDLILSGSDVDGDALTFTIVTQPAHGALSGNAPGLKYTPAANYHGQDNFTFKASDGTINSAPATVAITVLPANDAPAVTAQTLTTNEDIALPVTLTGTDVDGDALTFAIVNQPKHGQLSGTPPNLIYTPALNYYGPDAFSFQANDALTASTPAAINITVKPVNDPPAAFNETVLMDEDTPVTITLSGSDIDGDALLFEIITPPAHGTLSGRLPNIVYTPALNYHGPDNFIFRVQDPAKTAATAAITLTVASVNDAPVAQAQQVFTNQDAPVNITLAGSDSEGNALTYTIATQPAHGSLAGTPPNVIYTPTTGFFGEDAFSFTTNDGLANSAPAMVMIDINAAGNTIPVAQSAELLIAEDTSLPFTLTAEDTDGDALTFTILTPPAHGQLSGRAPNLTYQPAANYDGNDSFTFRVNDGKVNSRAATMTLIIIPVNDAPIVAELADTTLFFWQQLEIPLADYVFDVDNIPAEMTWSVNGANHLEVSINPATDMAVIKIKSPGFVGTETLTFTATDPGQLSDSSVLRVHAPQRMGDVDNDNALTDADVNLIRDHILGRIQLSAAQQRIADLTGDGEITIQDLVWINAVRAEGR